MTLTLTNAATRHNRMLRFLFSRAAMGLPLAPLAADWQPRKLQMPDEADEHTASAYHRSRRVNVRDAQDEVATLMRQPDRGTVQ